jgi:hypothetical protein
MAASAEPAQPPVIPVGLDCYRNWDEWPVQRIGARAYMRSTYDRSGGNSDASHFLYQLSDDDNVTLDVEGPGVLSFARYNHWHGSPWCYTVDGILHVVSETSTANPLHPTPGSVIIPAVAFPSPLTYTWSTTMGADLSWVPIPFERSFRMGYSRTHYGTGYYIYSTYVGGSRLSHPIRTWDASPPDAGVLRLIASAGSDIAPKAGEAGTTETHGHFDLSAGQPLTFGGKALGGSPSTELRALELSVPRSEAIAFGEARLSITWDGRSSPSIDAPVALFFGAGTLYNRGGKEYLVRAFPMVVRFDSERVYLSCYFPMPYRREFSVRLASSNGKPVGDVHWSVRTQPVAQPMRDLGYFHATYKDHGIPVPGQDLELLDTAKAEGGGNWTGSFVGTSFIFSDRANLATLEGDPRFFFDDSRTPQAQGTGTEEWCGGGDYWGGRNMTLPFAGHPAGAHDPAAATAPEDMTESAYRFLLGDLMPFGRNARICLEHGGSDESTEHYRSVAYWYGIPGASLVLTDRLKVCDARDEEYHRYVSPQASAPYSITSRYELGVDHLAGPGSPEAFPAETDTGRTTTGTSEFTLNINPANVGVLLRRKLDYAFPNQRAEVDVADDTPGAPAWHRAGTWYLAGSNACIYSNPDGELGAAQHVVQVSNRRFRDDEFLIPRPLTQGRSRIRVRVRFTPVRIPLYPGRPLHELAWSEIRYDAYCFVMPDFDPDRTAAAAP